MSVETAWYENVMTDVESLLLSFSQLMVVTASLRYVFSFVIACVDMCVIVVPNIFFSNDQICIIVIRLTCLFNHVQHNILTSVFSSSQCMHGHLLCKYVVFFRGFLFVHWLDWFSSMCLIFFFLNGGLYPDFCLIIPGSPLINWFTETFGSFPL